MNDAPGTWPGSFWFAGEQYDPDTGLIYLRARYYDPALGRFLSVDPKIGDIKNTQSLNPYAYALNEKADKVKGKFKVMPFPSFEGGGKAGILGGHNSVISAYSKNPGAALKLIEFIGSPEIQKAYAAQFSLTPVRNDVYDDPAVKKALPFAAELKQAVEQAKARRVSPVYPQISQAIYKNVNAALAGQSSPEDAMKNAQAQIEKALSTF